MKLLTLPNGGCVSALDVVGCYIPQPPPYGTGEPCYLQLMRRCGDTPIFFPSREDAEAFQTLVVSELTHRRGVVTFPNNGSVVPASSLALVEPVAVDSVNGGSFRVVLTKDSGCESVFLRSSDASVLAPVRDYLVDAMEYAAATK